jgi:hypothetical protein
LFVFAHDVNSSHRPAFRTLRRPLLAFLLVGLASTCSAAAAMPGQSSFRDVIYTPQGQPFSGTISFVPEGFPTDDRPPELIVPVSDGMLSVKLAATASSPDAKYIVTYIETDRVAKWTEIWQVPNGDRLSLNDVRANAADDANSQKAITLPVPMSGISGLATAISQTNALLTNLTTKINSLSAGLQPYDVTKIVGEAPTGAINGSNGTFSLANTPVSGSLELSKNGVVQVLGADYTLASGNISFQSGSIPAAGDTLAATYNVASAPITRGLREVDIRAISLPLPISSVSGLNAALGNINTTISHLNNSVTAINSVVTTVTASQPVIGEVLSGTADGANAVFSLAQMPSSAGSVSLYRNGVRNLASSDYTISGQAVTFQAGSIPQAGDLISANYQAQK